MDALKLRLLASLLSLSRGLGLSTNQPTSSTLSTCTNLTQLDHNFARTNDEMSPLLTITSPATLEETRIPLNMAERYAVLCAARAVSLPVPPFPTLSFLEFEADDG